MHLNSYFETLKDNKNYTSLRASIQNTIDAVLPKVDNYVDHENPVGLLLGNVQSGKTGQLFGLIAALADTGYKIFILTTTDSTALQEQTFERAVSSLPTFTVCGEYDMLRLKAAGLSKPVIIVLKKNTNVLNKWKRYLAEIGLCSGQPLIIVDDEADAASLNTKVNKDEVSQINQHLQDIKKLSSSLIYIQVTATPQALILQTAGSGFKPLFVHFFPPGEGYIGGNFVYSDPMASCIRIVDNELGDILQEDQYIPDGLKQAVMSFLVAGADVMLSGGEACNFLIHPSHKITDHSSTAKKVAEFLNSLYSASTDELDRVLKDAWMDLQKTKSDIKSFDEIKVFVEKVLEETNIKIVEMNSISEYARDFSKGFNIIIGGNTLGRGITFPSLQTVYYCRQSKVPQADTFWQHCRIFGYDRDRGLLRLYIPVPLLKLFTELNQANTALIKQVLDGTLETIHLMFPPGIRPTRPSVIDKTAIELIAGGVNSFPFYIAEDEAVTEFFDNSLKIYPDGFHDTTVDDAINFLSHINIDSDDDWSPKAYINALKAWKVSKEPGATKCKLLISRNRDIAKGTGTLLSPKDREDGDKITDVPVLTLYRLNGTTDKGWSGKPLWIPNIKLPSGKIFYKTEE